MRSRWLVAICAGREQLNSIRIAREAGFKVFGIDQQACPYAINDLDRFGQADIADIDTCEKLIRAEGLNIVGIDSFVSEVGLISASHLRERFGMKGITVEQAMVLTNKHRMRQKIKELGLESIAWLVSSDLPEMQDWARRVPGPWIIKPVDSSGSRGVFKISTLHDLETHFDKSKSFSRTRQVLIEEFLVGTEYSVETIVIDHNHYWLTSSERVRLHETTAVEIFTCDLAPSTRTRIFEQISRFIAGIGLQDAPLHSELIVTEEGRVVIVEIAGRCGGAMVSQGMVPAATGYALQAAGVAFAVGGKPPVPVNLHSRYVSLVFLLSTPGRLKAVSADVSPGEVPETQFEIFPKVGDMLGEAVHDGSRVGYVLAVADRQEQARARAKLAKDRINLILE